MITLSYLTTTVQLHPDLYWQDEQSWFPVEQSLQRTTTGGMIVSTASRTGGRPITLHSMDESTAWMNSADLETLRNLAVVPGRVMQLTLRGQTRDVIFRHQDGAVIEATPVVHYSDRLTSDWYTVTLRFMEL